LQKTVSYKVRINDFYYNYVQRIIFLLRQTVRYCSSIFIVLKCNWALCVRPIPTHFFAAWSVGCLSFGTFVYFA